MSKSKTYGYFYIHDCSYKILLLKDCNARLFVHERSTDCAHRQVIKSISTYKFIFSRQYVRGHTTPEL